MNLGTFTDVVHRHDEAARIRWHLDWTLPETLEIRDPMAPRRPPLFSGEEMWTECEVGLRQARLWPYRLAYRFGGVEFRLQPRHGSEDEFDLATDAEEFGFKRTQRSHPGRFHIRSRRTCFPIEARSYYQNSDFLGDFELAYEKLMDSLYYLGPLRGYPRREYHWAGASPSDVGQRGERTVEAILAATRDGEMRRLMPQAREQGNTRSRRSSPIG